MSLINLTKEQAKIKLKIFKPANRKVIYISKFDKEVVFRKGKISKDSATDDKKSKNTTIDKIRYLEDDRPLYRFDIITKEEILKSEEIITYIDNVSKKLFVMAKSGGISLFDMVNPILRLSKNECWYGLHIPKTVNLPDGLIIAKDVNTNRDGITHYSIQPSIDMSIDTFKSKLLELARYMKAL